MPICIFLKCEPTTFFVTLVIGLGQIDAIVLAMPNVIGNQLASDISMEIWFGNNIAVFDHENFVVGYLNPQQCRQRNFMSKELIQDFPFLLRK